jgi:chorismate synthase
MTIDGVPAGEAIDLEILQTFLNRRAPGRFPWTTSRKEPDIPEFISGLKDGKTTGAPITAIIRNQNSRSSDYDDIKDIPRPGHADYSAHVKYGGHADMSGGGRFSGRLTAALCIAGGICLQILKRRNVTIGAHIASIYGVSDQPYDMIKVDVATLEMVSGSNFPVLDNKVKDKMIAEIDRARLEKNSLGGIIECAAVGLPPGLGEHIFGGMENRIAGLIFGIPAVTGLEFGGGFMCTDMTGSGYNDPFYFDGDVVKTKTNNHGGILGGITTGMPLIFRASIKPTPSIAQTQESVNLRTGVSTKLETKGRHDPCIVPRAVPCIESVAAIAILDAML